MKTRQNLLYAIEQKKNEIARAILEGWPQSAIDALEAELRRLEQELADLEANPEGPRP